MSYSGCVCTAALMSSAVADGGMHVMFAQVAKGLFQRLICTRFRFLQNSILLVSYLAFDCIQHTRYEIDLDVHRT